jgi:AraC family transcriptional regulator
VRIGVDWYKWSSTTMDVLLSPSNGPLNQVSRAIPVVSGGELTVRRFARVRDYIEHNLGEAISLEDLARVAGVSRFHFARQFRRCTGESPMEYLLRTRVERAKMLLRESQARVADISAELGFADQSHFARTFRRLVGMPPSTYARGRAAAAAITSRP